MIENNQPETNESPSSEQDMPLLAHLLELRNRLLKILIVILIVFVCLFYWANDIYLIISAPLIEHLQDGATMIATDIISPFLTPFKMTAFLALIVAFPYILHQIWGFISPGLYRHERRFAVPLLASSILLFYLGMAFAYFIVFPLAWEFLTAVAPEGIAVTPDMSSYLNIVLKMFFAFGLAFEVPVATVLIVWSGLTSVESLKQKRRYVIVGAFIAGMLLTPPDMISQTLIAIPMWLLFELGILFAAMGSKKSSKNKKESDTKTELESDDSSSEKPHT